MDPLTNLYFWKIVRFLVGLSITVAAGLLGRWHGRYQLSQGKTLETLIGSKETSWKRLIVIGVLFYGIYLALVHWGGLEILLIPVTRYRLQFGMVLLRSLLVFLAVLQWTVAAGDARLKRALILVAVSCLIMTGVEVMTLVPMADSLHGFEIDKSGVVIQTTGFSCAPASLVTVCRMYGRVISERESALAMEAGLNGTTLDEMALGARALGFPEALPHTTTLEQIASADLPVLISIKFLDVWDLHATAILGLSSTTVYIADPLVGLRTFPRDKFHEVWRGATVSLGRPTFAASAPVSLAAFSPEAFKAFSRTLGGGTASQTRPTGP